MEGTGIVAWARRRATDQQQPKDRIASIQPTPPLSFADPPSRLLQKMSCLGNPWVDFNPNLGYVYVHIVRSPTLMEAIGKQVNITIKRCEESKRIFPTANSQSCSKQHLSCYMQGRNFHHFYSQLHYTQTPIAQTPYQLQLALCTACVNQGQIRFAWSGEC